MGGNGVSVTQILLGTLTGGGLLGAIVALLKLRPDNNTAAVTQSQSAMETMATLNKQLEAERNEWRTRALECESAARVAQEMLVRAKNEITSESDLREEIDRLNDEVARLLRGGSR